jgi:two-component system CheB/CheR fusion protein
MTSQIAVLEQTANSEGMLVEEVQDFEVLLNYLWESFGFDFRSYKRCSLMRQVRRRMKVVAIARYRDYIHYLKEHPEEFPVLLEFILVNFTGFFRDPLVWEHIATEIIPRIIANKTSNELIKVWSAGCASGEEAYTLAILLAEALGVEQFKQRVRIYATDLDPEAIHQARQGTYSSNRVLGVPPAILARYFERIDENYIFRQDLRRSLIFAQLNLLQNAPMSKVDLLLCRNTLMYFTIEGQIRALVRFYFGLRDTGFLVLGNTEMPTSCTNSTLFNLVHQQHRIFTKIPKAYTPRLLIQAFQRLNKKSGDKPAAANPSHLPILNLRGEH